MEFWIAFGVTFVVGMIYKAGKKQNNNAVPTQKTHFSKSKAKNVQDGKLTQVDEELITIILPTINHPK